MQEVEGLDRWLEMGFFLFVMAAIVIIEWIDRKGRKDE